MGGPDMAPHTPQGGSERPGEPGALLGGAEYSGEPGALLGGAEYSGEPGALLLRFVSPT
jgi:hypothetical protein